MFSLIECLKTHAKNIPHSSAVKDNQYTLNYTQLYEAVVILSEQITSLKPQAIGLLMDNSVAWVVSDLAAQLLTVPIVPLPAFFSAQQLHHVIHTTGIDLVLTDQPTQVQPLLTPICQQQLSLSQSIQAFQLSRLAEITYPPNTLKITYTSGTTGQPKGVCLSLENMMRVVDALVSITQATPKDQHVCVLPLPLLLENIVGVYAPLSIGACCCVPSLQTVGLQGATSLDVLRLLNTLSAFQATTAIVLPQMLQAMVEALEAGVPNTLSLRFLAVGGAPVSTQLLARAQQCNLPVYEGYGLSECASVVTLNVPDANQQGSVGKPLPHVRLRFAEDGEILAKGAVAAGYLDKPFELSDNFLPTGDLGYLDEAGFLYLTGRKKNCFITAFGRNVAPEWVEKELVLQPEIAQAFVFGEAKPFNVAVLVPRKADITIKQLTQAVERTNQDLPDYAKVHAWTVAQAPFTPQNNQLTATGRLRREVILKNYKMSITHLYEGKEGQ